MKLLIPIDTLKNYKSRDLISVECDYCHKACKRTRQAIQKRFKASNTIFCSRKCYALYLIKEIPCNCKNCTTPFFKKYSQYHKTKNHFCSCRCAGIYNNAHKTKGNNRSKLEIWLEPKLKSLYPKLEFKFNDIKAINAELDIYIPKLKLAFELNGIFHYEDIFKNGRLKTTQSNDNRKFQVCTKKKINLCVIDTSKQRYFKEHTAKQYLDIIAKIIDSKNGAMSR